MKIILTEKQFKSLILLGEGYTKGYIEIKRLAKKCSSLEEFKRKYNNLYEDIVVKYNMESYLKSLFYDKMSIKEIKQELIDGKYVNRTDIIKKNIKLYNAANLISDKYNLIDGVDDILTQVFPKKHPIKLKDFTVDDVVNFIRKYGYKTRSEFAEDKINNGLSVYTGVNKIIRNKALDIVFPIGDRFKFDVNKATVDDVVEFIRSGGYKTRNEFRKDKVNGGSRVYGSVDSDIRNKALDIVFPNNKIKGYIEIKRLAKKCSSLEEFKRKYNNLYEDIVVKYNMESYLKSLFYDKMSIKEIKQELIDGKYVNRTDVLTKNKRLYDAANLISDKYNLIDGVDDILTQVFPKKHGFNPKDATVDDVVNFIRKYGYKTRSEFAEDKVHGGLSIYTGVNKIIRNKALDIVFPIGDRFKFDVNKATVDDVVEFIRSGGYKTRNEFRKDKVNGGSRVYGNVDSNIRNKALDIVFPNNKIKGTTVDNKEKRYYSNQTSSYPDISFKYSVEESVRKILKTMI